MRGGGTMRGGGSVLRGGGAGGREVAAQQWWMCYNTVFLNSCDKEFYVHVFRTQHKICFLPHVFTICSCLCVFRKGKTGKYTCIRPF